MPRFLMDVRLFYSYRKRIFFVNFMLAATSPRFSCIKGGLEIFKATLRLVCIRRIINTAAIRDHSLRLRMV